MMRSVIAISMTWLMGCQAYSNAVNGALDHANVVNGSAEVTNTMSVAICGYEMIPDGDGAQTETKMVNKAIAPGGVAQINIPYVGKPSENPPQPERWTTRFYGCKKDGFNEVPGTLLTSVPLKKDESVAIR